MQDINSYVDDVMFKAAAAAAVYTQYDQKQTDKIVRAVYEAALNDRIRLAKMAVQETGMGKWEDKVIKNVVASQFVYESIKEVKTCGIISEDQISGITEIAQPLGPILAVIPTTNPTSTVIFKIMICLKARNPIVISPHRNAHACCVETAEICYKAALNAGAPDDCVQILQAIEGPKHREQTHLVMSHPKLALILATGGPGLVNAAYSSGTPALGVGAGNVPVFIEKSADLAFAAEQIFISKTFDNGTICASEQALVVEKSVEEKFRREIETQGGYFLNQKQVKAVEEIAFDAKRGSMSPNVVGQSALKIAEMAKIKVPDNTRILIASLGGIGGKYPLSSEILCPILAYYVADDFDEAINLCIDLNFHGGMGHTASIFSNVTERIENFSQAMNAGRIVVNMPSSQGAVGGIFNTIDPSLTLGCGSGGKNITTDNITAKHLINIQRITRRRVNERMMSFDQQLYFDDSVCARTIEKEFNKNY